MTIELAILPGDGIGPEVTSAAIAVLSAVSSVYGLDIEATSYPFGGSAIDIAGTPFPDATRAACRRADAVLLGAVGGPRYDEAAKEGAPRPEEGLLDLRKALNLFANLRPSRLFKGLERASPLRPELIAGTDILVIRELTGGLYFGDRKEGSTFAQDTLPYSREEVMRIGRIAFDAARGRRKRLTSVDKANVLATSRLWRSVMDELSTEYPDVELEHVLVDAMAMHLVTRPSSFDVVVTENLFGDILSDELSAVVGSIGLAPSASLGEPGTPGVYEPIHGSAPDIAGRGASNPLGAILSAAMLLRHSVGEEEAATAIEGAVERALTDGIRSRDLGADAGTAEVAGAVIERLGER